LECAFCAEGLCEKRSDNISSAAFNASWTPCFSASKSFTCTYFQQTIARMRKPQSHAPSSRAYRLAPVTGPGTESRNATHRGVAAFSRFRRSRAATEVLVFFQSCGIFLKIRWEASRANAQAGRADTRKSSRVHLELEGTRIFAFLRPRSL
jgi:hypothetical protein